MSYSYTASAPGKVLVIGGYMVLERPNKGLVIGLTSRLHCQAQQLSSNNSFFKTIITSINLSALSRLRYPKRLPQKEPLIEIVSPQFNEISSFKFDFDTWSLSPNGTTTRNEFTENAILYTFWAAKALLGSKDAFLSKLRNGIRLTINGDNDFYSQLDNLKQRGLPITYQSLAQLPKFVPVEKHPTEGLRKTGLGSSAALVSSMVSAILAFFEIIPADHLQASHTTLIHNVAQLCHCAAQGKIGSGFDVSSAVYGSQVYTRFSKEILEPFMSHNQDQDLALAETMKKNWDNIVQRISLPFGMRLLLGDVNVGSKTPGLVSKVLKWKQSDSRAPSLVNDLVEANHSFIEQFQEFDRLSRTFPQYGHFLSETSRLDALSVVEFNNPVAKSWVSLRATFLRCRQLLREIGNQSQAEIEPQTQEKLLDETMSIPGVLVAGVPGAGGYDAVFAIVVDDARIVDSVASLWSKNSVLPLLPQQETKGIEIVKEVEHNHVSTTKVIVVLSTAAVGVAAAWFYFNSKRK